jgi:hypothetical protein
MKENEKEFYLLEIKWFVLRLYLILRSPKLTVKVWLKHSDIEIWQYNTSNIRCNSYNGKTAELQNWITISETTTAAILKLLQNMSLSQNISLVSEQKVRNEFLRLTTDWITQTILLAERVLKMSLKFIVNPVK